MTRTTRRTGATAIAIGLMALPLAACSDSDDPPSAASTTASSAASGASTSTTVGEVLVDGEHVGYITRLQEMDDGTYVGSFDLAYLLTGDEAVAAASEAGVDLDTDHYIQNESPRERTITLAPDVVTTVVGEGDACCDSVQVPLQEFEEKIYPTFDVTTDVRSGPLVRLTIDQALVTRIDEVYLA